MEITLNIKKLFFQPMFWAFVTLILFDITICYFFKGKEIIISATISASVVIFGYFATHYLTMMRELREKKLIQCSEFLKKSRLLLLETDLKGTDDQKELRNEFQDSYFALSLLVPAKSYEMLSDMMNKFRDLISDNPQNSEKLKKFEKARSNFINSLRSQFFIDNKIDFKAYDIRLKNHNG